MPVYCFKSPKTEKVVEEFFHGTNPPELIVVDNVTYYRDLASEWACKPRTADPNAGNLSLSMGCLPTQYAEIAKVMAAHGVDYQTTPDGRAKIHSSSHRKAMMKVWGMKDMG